MKIALGKIDKVLLIVSVIFFVFGLLMIFSASSVSTILRYHVPSYYFFVRQLVFILASCIAGLFIILRIPTKKYNLFVWPLVIGIIIALAGLFVYGKVTGGAQSWYNLGFFKLQPSEFSKSILIIFFACYYDILSRKKTDNLYLYLIPLAIATIVGALVMMQPDFGSAVIIFGICFMIFISIPTIKKNISKIVKILLVALILGGIVLLYSGTDILNSTQLKRLQFQNPCQRYMESTGYQVCNGLIAIRNGGLFGVGLGNSTQKYLYLPESHTDFIFPIIVEELGFIVGAIVILGYGVVLYRLLKISRESQTLRGSIIAYGTFWYFVLHILINLMGILALIPLTGVPLPFLSYGGSFTLNITIMLFVVQRINIENKTIRLQKEIQAL